MWHTLFPWCYTWLRMLFCDIRDVRDMSVELIRPCDIDLRVEVETCNSLQGLSPPSL